MYTRFFWHSSCSAHFLQLWCWSLHAASEHSGDAGSAHASLCGRASALEVPLPASQSPQDSRQLSCINALLELHSPAAAQRTHCTACASSSAHATPRASSGTHSIPCRRRTNAVFTVVPRSHEDRTRAYCKQSALKGQPRRPAKVPFGSRKHMKQHNLSKTKPTLRGPTCLPKDICAPPHKLD